MRKTLTLLIAILICITTLSAGEMKPHLFADFNLVNMNLGMSDGDISSIAGAISTSMLIGFDVSKDDKTETQIYAGIGINESVISNLFVLSLKYNLGLFRYINDASFAYGIDSDLFTMTSVYTGSTTPITYSSLLDAFNATIYLGPCFEGVFHRRFGTERDRLSLLFTVGYASKNNVSNLNLGMRVRIEMLGVE